MSLMDVNKKMIDALPDEGAIIIVPSNEIGKMLMRGISERCGADFASSCRTVTVWRRGDIDKLIGMWGHVVIDYSFAISRVPPEVRGLVDKILDHPLVTVHRPDLGDAHETRSA